MPAPRGATVAESPSLTEKLATSFIVATGFLAFIVATILYSSDQAVKIGILIALVGIVMTTNAITVCFHRLLTHSSFVMNRYMMYAYVVVASFSVEGSVLFWCATHRKHHNFSDKSGDPHSPHIHGDGLGGIIKGFLHAHIGWFYREPKPDLERYVPDLLKDKGLVLLDKLFPVLAVLSFIIPGVIEWSFIHTWHGLFMGILWGGFVRVAFVHHLTWSINSICHIWGTKPFRSNDQSVNNFLFGLLAQGEGWHRNHHSFKWSAKIGLRWWEIDVGWYTILLMKILGLVRGIKVPDSDQLAKLKSA